MSTDRSAAPPPRALLALLAVVTGAAYALVPVLQYRRFRGSSWDNAIFEQGVAAYARLEAPVATIKGPDVNLLGDHFSPVIALLAPVYRLVPDARTLMVAQAVLLAVSVYVVGVAAVARLGRPAGLALTAAYALSFGIASAVQVDFHAVAFAVPLLALAGAAWLRGDVRGVLLWSLPLLLVKEDLGGTVAVIGLVLWLRRPARRAHHRGAGALLMVVGVFGALLVLLVVVPALSPDGTYAYLGDLDTGTTTETSGSVGLAGLLEGWSTKAVTTLLTVGVTALAGLFSPWMLVALPTLLWRFAGDNPTYWGTDWHYSLVLMPVVVVACVDAVERLRGSSRRALRVWARATPAIALGVAVLLAVGGPYPALFRPASWSTTPRAADAAAVLREVPPGASVETDVGVMSHLAADHPLWWVGTSPADLRPDYVLVDQVRGGWSGPVDAVGYAEARHPGSTYELVLARGGLQLARRVGP